MRVEEEERRTRTSRIKEEDEGNDGPMRSGRLRGSPKKRNRSAKAPTFLLLSLWTFAKWSNSIEQFMSLFGFGLICSMQSFSRTLQRKYSVQ